VRDCIGIAGLALTVAGLAMISRPAAVIAAGFALILCALFAPGNKKKTGE
jgi:hypothetical protein